jgi:hypothetical protein
MDTTPRISNTLIHHTQSSSLATPMSGFFQCALEKSEKDQEQPALHQELGLESILNQFQTQAMMESSQDRPLAQLDSDLLKLMLNQSQTQDMMVSTQDKPLLQSDLDSLNQFQTQVTMENTQDKPLRQSDLDLLNQFQTQDMMENTQDRLPLQ